MKTKLKNNYNFEAIYEFQRKDGKPCTKVDLKSILSNRTEPTFSPAICGTVNFINDTDLSLGLGKVYCHALINVTTDNENEETSAEETGDGIIFPNLNGYTCTLNDIFFIDL